MTELRHYKRFGRNYFLTTLITAVPSACLLMFVFWRATSDTWDLWTWFGIGAFIVAALFGLISQRRRLERFVCPECKNILASNYDEIKPGDPVEYLCTKCDIVWQVGLSESEFDN